MTFKFKHSRNTPKVALPTFPTVHNDAEEEALTGVVNNMKASAPEERLAAAYNRANISYIFRYVFGAPKGLPGWKELDFLVFFNGFLYAQEVDTAFTHREKAFKDILHDTLILNDPTINSMGMLYPQVRHIDGDADLANNANARAFVKNTFGR